MNTMKNVFTANTFYATIVCVCICLWVIACDSQDKATSKPFLIGLITNNPNGMRNVQGFKDGLKILGHTEGTDINYLFAGEPIANKNLTNALEKMVLDKVVLIFTAGTSTGIAAQKVTNGTDVPVVFGVIADPVGSGVIQDLTHPGGNMTGVKLSQNQDRRLELLLDIAPKAKNIFVPYNPTDLAAATSVSQIQEIADKLNVAIVEGRVSNSEEVAAMLDSIPEDIDAIFLVPDSTVNRHLQDIVRLSIQHRVPLSGPSTIQTEGGALTAYGIVHHQAGAQATKIAQRIINGELPGDIPIETAESFLSINLDIAKQIGFEISDDIVEQADYIIHDK
jgi:putative ABC transport system substrate-binding protein